MPHIIATRPDRDAALDEIERIVDRHLVVGLMPEQNQMLKKLLSYHRNHPQDLRVTMKIETIPEARVTRFTIDLSNEPPRRMNGG
jgi:hypothetical protein